MKVGGGIRHNENDVDQRYPGGRVQLCWDSAVTSTVPGVGTNRGTYGYYTVDDLGTFGEASANISHFYAQDQWSVGRLTLNLGVRFEDEKIPAFRDREVAIHFGWGEKIAPRIGAAYDMFGDGRTKLFGSYGRYYDWTKYELARGTFGGDIWTTYYRPLDDPSIINSINLDNMPGRDLWGKCRGLSGSSCPSFGTDQLDPNMKPMSQDSFSGGFEYQLEPTMLLSVNYIHNKLIRTIEDVGQLVDGSEVYVYGNPGEGIVKDAFISTATGPFEVPRPKRQYDALQVSLNRRFSGNWFVGGSYVLSRLYGNYAGLASSDEIRTPGFSNVRGRSAAGCAVVPPRRQRDARIRSRRDDVGLARQSQSDGRLATDRPHVLKMYGAYMTPFGTQIGLNQYVGSGTPLTTYVRTINATEVFVEGRGDHGRTPMLAPTDLLLSHEFGVQLRAARAVRVERSQPVQSADGSSYVQPAESQPFGRVHQSGKPGSGAAVQLPCDDQQYDGR